MTSDALGEAIPTAAEFDLAYKLAAEANCKAAIYWQNYVNTGDHQGIFEPLSKLAIELTKALVRTPHVAGWLIQCNCTKEPPLEIGGREFSTAHHAALACVCRVVDGVISETRPNPDHKFNRRSFDGWNWEKLEKRITREYVRVIEALPDGKRPSGQQQPTKSVRRLNVQKVQGSERSFKIDRKPVTLSPACANILNGFIALKESGEPATPANLMTKLSPKYDKNRKRFEDDKGRFNDALEAAGIAKGLYVDGDVFRLCKPPKKTPAKAVRKNGMKTVRRR